MIATDYHCQVCGVVVYSQENHTCGITPVYTEQVQAASKWRELVAHYNLTPNVSIVTLIDAILAKE